MGSWLIDRSLTPTYKEQQKCMHGSPCPIGFSTDNLKVCEDQADAGICAEGEKSSQHTYGN